MDPSSYRATPPKFVRLYDGTGSDSIEVETLAEFLRRRVPSVDVEVFDDFLSECLARAGEELREQTARRIAKARVRDPERAADEDDPIPGEVEYEKRFLTAGGEKPSGLLYDGHMLLEAFAQLLHADEVLPTICHVVLTNQLFGTRPKVGRYHARVSLYGVPSLISTSGLVQAPARPREYYTATSVGSGGSNIPDELRERYLSENDPRAHEALKGYLFQALFYHATGEPFCDDESCRLFNAHWQEELLRAQVGEQAGLCQRHQEILERWE
ncbi:MAG: DUF6775 family putative metallopeptidase [Candidatus Brocadiia bacterium]